MNFLPFVSKSQKNTAVIEIGEDAIRFGVVACTRKSEASDFLCVGVNRTRNFSWTEQLDQTIQHVKEKYRVSTVVFNLPPSIFRAHVFHYRFKRGNPQAPINSEEEERLGNEIIENSRQQALAYFAEKFGISEEELVLTKIRILETRVNGFPVSALSNVKGETLSVRALITCLPTKHHMLTRELQKRHNIRHVELLHWAETIEAFSDNAPDNKGNAMYVAIKDTATQLCVMYRGTMRASHEFPLGEESIIHALEEKLNLGKETMHDYMQRYARGEFSEKMRQTMHNLILEKRQRWVTLITEALAGLDMVLPSRIFLMGEGSSLPEFQQLEDEQEFAELPLNGPLRAAVLAPKDIAASTAFSQNTNPLYTPLFLLGYAEQKKNS